MPSRQVRLRGLFAVAALAWVLAQAAMISAQTIVIAPPVGGSAVITGSGFPPGCTQTSLQAVVGGVFSHRVWLGGFDTQDGSFAYNFNFPAEAEEASDYLWIGDPYWSNCPGMVLRGQNPGGDYPRAVTLETFDLAAVPATITIDGPPPYINQVVRGSGLTGMAGRLFVLLLGGVGTNAGQVWADGSFAYNFNVTDTPPTYPRSVALQFYYPDWTPGEVFSGVEEGSTPYPHTVSLSPYGSLSLENPVQPQSSVIHGAGFPANCPSSLSAVYEGSLYGFGGLGTGSVGWWDFNFNFPEQAQNASAYVWTGFGPCEGLVLKGANPGGPYPRDIRMRTERPVVVDIRPGGACPNPVNVASEGVLPVAILGEPGFDVGTVDVGSIRLAQVAPLRSAIADVAGPSPGPLSPTCSVTTAPDGIPDLTLQFDVRALRPALDVTDGSAVTLTLTGLAVDGAVLISGSDTVKVKVPHDQRPAGCVPAPAGLTGWWHGDGNGQDIVGGREAAFHGDAATGAGLVGQAFLLDGEGDFVSVPHQPGLDVGTKDFTVDLWVNFDHTQGEQVLIEKWVQGDPPSGWTLTKLEGNVLRLAVASGDWSEASIDSDVLPIRAGVWTHFAARREGDRLTTLMNGIPVAAGSYSGSLSSGSSLKFGHRGGPNDTPGSWDDRGFYLKGRIDEVELFVGKALPDALIRKIVDAGSAGKCKY